MKFFMVMKRAIAEYNDYYNSEMIDGLLLIPNGYKKEQKNAKVQRIFLRCTFALHLNVYALYDSTYFCHD